MIITAKWTFQFSPTIFGNVSKSLTFKGINSLTVSLLYPKYKYEGKTIAELYTIITDSVSVFLS